MEAGVEFFQDAFPAALPGLNLIELLFHVGCEFDADDIRKAVHHQTVHNLAELRWREFFVRLDDILAVLNGRNNGRIG